jgi:hypothetical protein
MTIAQRNQYSTSQNIANLANNVDYNRLGLDKSSIDVTFASGTVVVETGSLIECLGNLYAVTADETLSGATGQQYIHFDGSSFTLSTDRGVYDAEKVGYYDTATGLKRVLKYLIDSDADRFYTLFSYKDGSDNFYISGISFAEDLRGTLNMYAIGDIEVYTHTYAGGTDNTSDFNILKPVILYCKNNTDGETRVESTFISRYYNIVPPGTYRLSITSLAVTLQRKVDSTYITSFCSFSTPPTGGGTSPFSNTASDEIALYCTYAEGLTTLSASDIVEE